jgi:hypothetical protein
VVAESIQESMPEVLNEPRRILTSKAIVVGILAVVGVNLLAPFSEWIVRSTHMTTNYFPLGLASVFIFLVVVINPALKMVHRRGGLSGDELGVVYIMLLAAVSVPTYGVTGYMMSVSASPFYFATTENGWSEFVHPHVPMWAVPGDRPEVAWFFEGLPPGAEIPWGVWMMPLFWWGSVILATLTLCNCLIAVFRKQWVDKERLNFPLVDVPLMMMEGAESRELLPKFMCSPLFWIGFGIAAGKIAWNVPGYFFEGWPSIPAIKLSIPGGKIWPGIGTNLSLPLLGITYFVNVDVIFSVWFFNLFNMAEVALFNRTGFTIGTSEIYSVSPAALAWQGFGAFVAIVFGGIWVAREHLRGVWRTAMGKAGGISDWDEVIGYRTALLGIFLGALYILFWLTRIGIHPGVALLLLFAVVTLYLGLTRIVIEGGLVFVRGPLLPQAFAMHLVGPADLSGSTMTGLGLSYGWACDPIATFMPFGANAARVHSERGFPRGVYLTAVGLALGISLIVSFWFSLKLAYASGAYNFGEWVFRRGGQVPFDTVVAKIKAAETLRFGHFAFLGLGALATVLLTYLRHRFTWWRLHPIGFSIASVGQVKWTMLSLFTAWAIKVLLIRFGGLILYNRAKPIFVGLVVGHFAGAGVSFVIDALWFRGQGHSLYF